MVINTRYIAYNILRETLDGGYLNLVLKKYLKNLNSYDDKRFCNALVSVTLEKLFFIDYVVLLNLKQKKIKLSVKNILRIGVCQILFMDSVPDRAAVNETVKLCSQLGKQACCSFVNAVLRKVCEHKKDYNTFFKLDNPLEYLSVNYSYPLWICELLVNQYGYESALSLLSYESKSNRVCFRVRNNMFPEQFLKGYYTDNCFYLENAKDINEYAEYKNGDWCVMSEASVVCVEAAGLSGTEFVLDLCSAPGNKGLFAAERSQSVVLCDIHQNRIDLIRKNIERLKINNVKTILNDATSVNHSFIDCFDCVFCDVPCSEMGLMYRKPDVRYHKQSEDVSSLVKIQKSILNNASLYVRKGGFIMYSTCTIDKKENAEVVESFLETHSDFYLGDIISNIPNPLRAYVKNKFLQLMPDRDGIDGFFICKLMRKC